MGGEWNRVQVSDVCELIVDCVNKTAPTVDCETPFKMLRTPNIKGGRVSTENCKYVTYEIFKKWTRRAEVKRDDVLLTREAPLGEVGIVKSDEKLFLGQRLMQYRANTSLLNADFLTYAFLSPDLQNQFRMHEGSGSVVSHIRVGDCFKFELNLPSLGEQEEISGILASLDRKIELNRQINSTLESMAQALFKSWFVDFDPVIDNALAAGNRSAGRPIPDELSARAQRRQSLRENPDNPHPPLPTDIQQLFPSSFVFTEEMGWVPEGWVAVRFDEIADVIMGQSPKGDTYNVDGEGLPLVNGPVEFGSYFTEKSKWTTAPTKFAKKGDLVVCVRGSTTGRYVKSDGEYCLGRGVCSVRARNSQAFVDLTFKHNVDRLLQLTTGSTFPNWSGPTLKSFFTVYPGEEILSAFDRCAARWVERIEYNVVESSALSGLRDILLPKLLSGQLQVPEVEQKIHDAT